MDREKQLSILYQKQGRATQFASKAARDKWLQKEIDDLERVLSSNMKQVTKKNHADSLSASCSVLDLSSQLAFNFLFGQNCSINGFPPL